MTFRFIRLILLSIIIISLSINIYSQNKGAVNNNQYVDKTGSISGVIINSLTFKPIEYAYLVLRKGMDSSMVAGGISDTLGKFKIEKIPFGKYYLVVNLIGHKSQKISNIVISPKELDKKIDTIKLNPNSANLNTFEIKEKKQTVEYTLDKKVINVEKNLVSAGGSAVDVMQAIPSVTVDIEGNISLRGSSNVTVLIDGKLSGLTGMSRSAILEQIPASSIESIEIISNPSAKYDPDGMTGIINIVLKKKKERGYNGVFTANAGTGDKYNGSIALNFSKNKVNVFANFDGRINNSVGFSNMSRIATINDTLSYLESNDDNKRKRIARNFKIGTDFYLNDKNTFTISGICGISDNTDNEYSKSKELDADELISNYYESNNVESGKNESFDYMLNYKRTFKKKGESITADAIFSTSNETEASDRNLQYYLTDMSTINGNPELQHILTDNKSDVSTIQVDYSNPLSKKSRFEAGAKSIIRSMDNDYKFLNFVDSSGIWSDDSLLSNRFLYDEQIHAVYTTYSNTFGVFEFQAGLRAEQALTRSTQKTMNTEYKKDYFSIFPTLHLNLNLKNDNSLQLSYSRRVNRPSYHMLNPFVDVSNPGFRHYGNPYLTPEYIDSYELGHLKYWKNTSLNSSVFYKQINDAIQRYVYIDNNGIQNVTAMNISKGISYGLEFILTQDFAKWWKVNATFSYFRTIMKGAENGAELTNSNYSWTSKLNSNMTVLKNLDIQLTGNYRAPMVQLQGTMKAMYFANIALKKDILKNKASVTLRLSDIFNTQQFNMVRTGTDFTIDMKRKRESRVFFVGFTYKINGDTNGKNKKKTFDNNDNIDINDF